MHKSGQRAFTSLAVPMTDSVSEDVSRTCHALGYPVVLWSTLQHSAATTASASCENPRQALRGKDGVSRNGVCAALRAICAQRRRANEESDGAGSHQFEFDPDEHACEEGARREQQHRLRRRRGRRGAEACRVDDMIDVAKGRQRQLPTAERAQLTVKRSNLAVADAMCVRLRACRAPVHAVRPPVRPPVPCMRASVQCMRVRVGGRDGREC